MPTITPRNTRSRKLPVKPDQAPNRGRAGDSPPDTMKNDILSEGKNNRKRSSNSDEETCPTPPRKKRATNVSPPTACPSAVSTRAVLRSSTRKASQSARKEANVPAEPNSDVIVVDNDGYPYVAYDDAPHLHPPPRRGKQKESDLPAGFRGKVKGCSIKSCWTPTQQRRCRILQTDEAVREIGWKKVRKWMQAVRCGLCGETQVLRDLTKGCFNLEHWWRHLRVRHGIKRDEEFEEKGEEKYKALPIKDHVCVGACATCGEGGEVVSRRQQNPSPKAARAASVELADSSSLSSVDTIPRPSRKPSPEITLSPHFEPRYLGHTASGEDPSNDNYPPPYSALCTLADARPQYLYNTIPIHTTFPISSCRDLPPLVLPSLSPYISHPSSPLTPTLKRIRVPASDEPSSTRNLSTSTSKRKRTSITSATSTISSPRLPPATIAPPARPRTGRDTADNEKRLVNRQSPTSTISTGASTAPSTHRTRQRLPSRSTSALPPTASPATIASSSSIRSSSSRASSRPPPSHSTTADAVTRVPSLSDYRWPPANNPPVGAPSPPRMTAASWEEHEGDLEDGIEVPRMLQRPPRNVQSQDASKTEDGGGEHDVTMQDEARILHHFWVSARKDWGMIEGPPATAPTRLVHPTRREAADPRDSERLPHPVWAFIKQEESDPETDEDEDMVDQLLD